MFLTDGKKQKGGPRKTPKGALQDEKGSVSERCGMESALEQMPMKSFLFSPPRPGYIAYYQHRQSRKRGPKGEPCQKPKDMQKTKYVVRCCVKTAPSALVGRGEVVIDRRSHRGGSGFILFFQRTKKTYPP